MRMFKVKERRMPCNYAVAPDFVQTLFGEGGCTWLPPKFSHAGRHTPRSRYFVFIM